MATVEFDSPNEFLAELAKDSRYVDRNIVRVTEQKRASSMSSAFLVSVVGAARVGADIYRVECVCGIQCGIEAADRRVIAQMHKQFKSLRASCAGLGLDVRSGVLEENP